jgi:hypothetical protein
MRLITLLILILSYADIYSQVKLSDDRKNIQINRNGKSYTFSLEFLILYNSENPHIALKPSGLKKVSYNIPTWKVKDSLLADYEQADVKASVAGDGFDDKILRSKVELRTVSIYNSGSQTFITPETVNVAEDSVEVLYSGNDGFTFKAVISFKTDYYPRITFYLNTLVKGYYSIGYIGAPAIAVDEFEESWQPLIWTEKRIPEKPYLTPSYMATLPATLVNDGYNTIGVLAAPEHLPFQPLPLMDNSQFGVLLLNPSGKLQPQIFAPMMGGYNSFMDKGEQFVFSYNMIVEPESLTGTYEKIAKNIFGFSNYRKNSIASMNTVLDNIVNYSKTSYAWFVDSLKGFAYSTDVPGAVKNVSSLNPLELAIVRDDQEMFEKRAYPLMEFMLSREKFLFSLDSNQKIQSPSRKLRGPIAPLSELAALYNIFGKQNAFYKELAQKEFKNTRVRNLDDNEKGYNWINAMFLYRMTNDTNYLSLSKKLADKYLETRVLKRAQKFGDDPLYGSHFFWPTFTNHWAELLELYEITGETQYLDAARDGARHYALFTWMVPAIPDSMVTVNKDGKAPMYWYLKQKGHEQMYYPEEKVPAWRLSEIGLTAESSGTSTGHRGIFMANFAPWMLRVGFYAKDSFLIHLAKAALIGRYTTFPGYHINTERTTAYEKEDFPLREHTKQSVNSFHYNHILPMASMLLDYIVSDVFVKSNGSISFPNEYIEGYAYLQNKFYGASKGNFYGRENVQLWMPERLLSIDNIELNYLSARSSDTLYIALSNQSTEKVISSVKINPEWVKAGENTHVKLLNVAGKAKWQGNGVISVEVPANGLTAIAISPVKILSPFQQKILSVKQDTSKDFTEIKEGNTKAFLFKLGELGRRLFVYLEDDDNQWREVKLSYKYENGEEKSIVKKEYPFEFTVDINNHLLVSFSLELKDKEGKKVQTNTCFLGQ